MGLEIASPEMKTEYTYASKFFTIILVEQEASIYLTDLIGDV